MPQAPEIRRGFSLFLHTDDDDEELLVMAYERIGDDIKEIFSTRMPANGLGLQALMHDANLSMLMYDLLDVDGNEKLGPFFIPEKIVAQMVDDKGKVVGLLMDVSNHNITHQEEFDKLLATNFNYSDSVPLH